MEGLGHADPVEDLHAEPPGPALVERRRQRLARRDRQPHRPERVRRELGLQHVGEEGRPGEEQGAAVLARPLGDEVGPRRRGLEDRRRAHRHGKEDRVAEPVREERLGRRDAAVVAADAEDLCAVGLADGADRAVAMHGTLRLAGRARGVEPERRRVGPRAVHVDVGRGAGQLVEAVDRDGDVEPGAVRHQHAGELRGRVDRPRGHLGEAGGDGEEPGAGVPQELGQAVGPGHGGHRDGHGADPQGGEEHRHEVGAVRQEHHQALFGLEAELAQAPGGPARAVVELGVGQVPAGAGDREAVAVALLQAAIEQVDRGVEQVAHVALTPGARSRSRTAAR